MLIHSKSDRAKEIAEEVSKYITPGVKEDPDLILVVGGDGFLLESVKKFGFDKLYLPINGGHLGFLLNDIWIESEKFIPGRINYLAGEALRNKAWNVQEFPVLLAKLESEELDYSINDIYLERSSGQTCRLTVSIDSLILVKKMICDGVIISTPLGSTGYNFSAGGPVVHPMNEGVIITPSNAHQPSFRSIVLPSSAKIKIQAEDIEYRPVRTVVDGRDHFSNSVEVSFSNQKIRLGYFEGHDFNQRLLNKLWVRN